MRIAMVESADDGVARLASITWPTGVRWFVAGVPRPGGSKRAFPFRRGDGKLGVAVSDSGGERVKVWREAVRGTWPPDAKCFDGALLLDVCFIFKRPKAHFSRDGKIKDAHLKTPHTTRPDLTKLLRSTEDALTAVAWTDDAIIVSQTARKRYAHHGEACGAWIHIQEEYAMAGEYIKPADGENR